MLAPLQPVVEDRSSRVVVEERDGARVGRLTEIEVLILLDALTVINLIFDHCRC